jgi:hypothetical protein
MWYEPYALVLGIKLILFERKLAIYARHHEVTIAWFQCAIYYHDVAIAYASIQHAVAGYSGIEGAFWMSHHLAREVDGFSGMVRRWVRKTCVQICRYLQFDACGLGFGETMYLIFFHSCDCCFK